MPNYNIAGIAKAALESIVRYLAFDLGERGIRVNAISAGPIKTASSRQVAGFSAMPAKVAAAAPLKRNITTDDVGNSPSISPPIFRAQVTADVHFVDAGYHAMGMYPEARRADARADAHEELAAIAAAYLVADGASRTPAPRATRRAGTWPARLPRADDRARAGSQRASASRWNAAGRLDG